MAQRLILFGFVFGAMLVEAQRAAANERAQRARGGVEPAGDVYKLMRVAYPGAFAAMFLEGALRGAPSSAALATGLVVLLAAKLLKWWAILTLGRFWTFRVLVIPGAGLVARGPYRWLRHPNYIGVMAELAGTAAAAGAPWSGSVAMVTFGALIWKRIGVEERALRAAGP